VLGGGELSDGEPGHSPTDSGPTGDHSRIGVDFGSIGFCHVATGATDVFLDVVKGFALWDLLPGRLILEAAGGVITDLTGTPLPWPNTAFTDLDAMSDAMNTRQRFIAAANHDVARTVADTLDP
jgi:myo-inositol-1(or 4)-monophosphatase